MNDWGVIFPYFFTYEDGRGGIFPLLVRYIYYGWACARGSYCCSSIIISDGEDGAGFWRRERIGIFLVGLEVYRIAVLALIGENVAVSTAASPVQHGRVFVLFTPFSNGTGWDRFSIPCVCREPCLRFYSRTGCAIRRFILLRYRDLPSMPGLCST